MPCSKKLKELNYLNYHRGCHEGSIIKRRSDDSKGAVIKSNGGKIPISEELKPRD